MYAMSSGVAYVYDLKVGQSPGGAVVRHLANMQKYFYEEIGIGQEDYNLAKSEAVELTLRIRLLRRGAINTKQYVKIGDMLYGIWRVKHTKNKRGILVTDITLRAAIGGETDARIDEIENPT